MKMCPPRGEEIVLMPISTTMQWINKDKDKMMSRIEKTDKRKQLQIFLPS